MARQRLASWRPATRARVGRIRARLRESYGLPVLEPHGDAVAELILTVLSQSTNDRNRDVAYLRLRELGSWEAVRDAPLTAVERAIRPGGISNVKSRRIQAILRAIAPAGPLSLEFLAELPLASARDYLLALPGVGRKTAACVLLFAFGIEDVPVDTHVSRVGSRLYLLAPGASLTAQHEQMAALTPAGAALELHVNMLRHGRRICHARSPECAICPLARMCPSRQAFGSTRKAITA